MCDTKQGSKYSLRWSRETYSGNTVIKFRKVAAVAIWHDIVS